MDGTNVDGFPLQINEKIQRGVALADLNNNNNFDNLYNLEKIENRKPKIEHQKSKFLRF